MPAAPKDAVLHDRRSDLSDVASFAGARKIKQNDAGACTHSRKRLVTRKILNSELRE
jgi:hypothetical protein